MLLPPTGRSTFDREFVMQRSGARSGVTSPLVNLPGKFAALGPAAFQAAWERLDDAHAQAAMEVAISVRPRRRFRKNSYRIC
jgi:hypothetical protein